MLYSFLYYPLDTVASDCKLRVSRQVGAQPYPEFKIFDNGSELLLFDPELPFTSVEGNAGPCPVPDLRATRSGGPHGVADLIFAAIRATMPLTRVHPRSL